MKKSSRVPESAATWENYVVVQVVGAMLGLITDRIRSVSVHVDGDAVTLHFAMVRCDTHDEEDIADVCLELDVLLEGKAEIQSKVYVGPDDESWEGRQYRWVYRVKR